MFVFKRALARRTFLQAVGSTIALPFLDAMVPALAAQTVKPAPRLGFIYIANGVIQNQWNPATEGANFELTPLLQPFAKVRDMKVVEKLYSGYGEGAPSGKGPSQGRLQTEGNKYLKAEFPKMDYIKSATITK